MSDFAGMEELLQDFLLEASELLSDVDNKLVELERRPDDKSLLHDIFRSFHTIKGGAGFLNATELVTLCHRTETLFDKLRNAELVLSPETMDVIMAATGKVRDMFGTLSQARQPESADPALIHALEAAAAGEAPNLHGNKTPAAPVPPPVAASTAVTPAPMTMPVHVPTPNTASGQASHNGTVDPEWNTLYNVLLDKPTPATEAAPAPQVISQTPNVPAPAAQTAPTITPTPAASTNHSAPSVSSAPPPAPTNGSSAPAVKPQMQQAVVKETTIRIDTTRLDQVLNLSGEIGLTKNRLTCLRVDILQGKTDPETLKALDEAVSQLDLLVGDLQNAVMKTRMQPIGRLFQKYPRLARDLARQLGKEVELILSGEETELDKTMIEDLNDPIVHLVRNSVDHGLELPDEREAIGKPRKGTVRLSATQIGDHIMIEIADDGKGMRPDVIRRKAIEKGLIDLETANGLDDRQSLNLIFLPGFSTKDEISNVSGRGVGMDVVRTNITKLNGRIDISSVHGEGTTISIALPLTLAILPVLVVLLGKQPFAVPLSMVREIIPINVKDVQQVSGKATMVVRDEVLPIRSLASLLDWAEDTVPCFGVLMQAAETSFILAIDGFVGRDDVVIKPLMDIKPKGIAGATLSGDGSVVLVLDMEELLSNNTPQTRAALFARN